MDVLKLGQAYCHVLMLADRNPYYSLFIIHFSLFIFHYENNACKNC